MMRKRAGVVFSEENPAGHSSGPRRAKRQRRLLQNLLDTIVVSFMKEIPPGEGLQFLLVLRLQIDEIRLNLVLFAFHRDDPHGTSVDEGLRWGSIFSRQVHD